MKKQTSEKINDINEIIHDQIAKLVEHAIKTGVANESYLVKIVYCLNRLHDDMRQSDIEVDSVEQLNIFCPSELEHLNPILEVNDGHKP